MARKSHMYLRYFPENLGLQQLPRRQQCRLVPTPLSPPVLHDGNGVGVPTTECDPLIRRRGELAGANTGEQDGSRPLQDKAPSPRQSGGAARSYQIISHHLIWRDPKTLLWAHPRQASRDELLRNSRM